MSGLKTIGFVIPWYGDTIPGGAEADLRDLAKHMAARGIDLEILTTCVKEFTADWNKNYHKPGVTEEGGLRVRRFSVTKGDRGVFGMVNYRLMLGQYRISLKDEDTFLREMVNSNELYEYIREHKDEYSVFAFIPYMFGTTYNGIKECLEKAVLIPCFHNEPYTYFRRFREVYSNVRGMVFHAKPEYELTQTIYDLTDVKCRVLGGGMDTSISGDPERFRERYGIKDNFILYAGRKDVGKNIYTLIDYFREYRLRRAESTGKDLKLVLLGGGYVDIPKDAKDDIIDLGFVPIQDKFDAYSAAELTCQPSKNESFSIVIMESWLCGRPVIVCEECAVTTNFARESNGGLWFKDYYDFEAAVDFIMTNTEEANIMAENGKKYVKEHFDWDVVVDGYLKLFEEIAESA